MYLSRQALIDRTTGEIVGETVARAVRSLEQPKEAAGTGLREWVEVDVDLAHTGDFPELNEIYPRYLASPSPPKQRCTPH